MMSVLLCALVLGAALLLVSRKNAWGARPLSTTGLDEETAARARVSQSVPDGVLSDALLNATPVQLVHLFAAVPDEVMVAAVGSGSRAPQEWARPEDRTRLRGAGQAVDDLEIWSFGEKN